MLHVADGTQIALVQNNQIFGICIMYLPVCVVHRQKLTDLVKLKTGKDGFYDMLPK
jgi:hypothetical protein